MSTLYVMSLEDRVGLARDQLDGVILKLRHAVAAPSQSDEVEQLVRATTDQLQHISELIGR